MSCVPSVHRTSISTPSPKPIEKERTRQAQRPTVPPPSLCWRRESYAVRKPPAIREDQITACRARPGQSPPTSSGPHNGVARRVHASDAPVPKPSTGRGDTTTSRTSAQAIDGSAGIARNSPAAHTVRPRLRRLVDDPRKPLDRRSAPPARRENAPSAGSACSGPAASTDSSTDDGTSAGRAIAATPARQIHRPCCRSAPADRPAGTNARSRAASTSVSEDYAAELAVVFPMSESGSGPWEVSSPGRPSLGGSSLLPSRRLTCPSAYPKPASRKADLPLALPRGTRPPTPSVGVGPASPANARSRWVPLRRRSGSLPNRH